MPSSLIKCLYFFYCKIINRHFYTGIYFLIVLSVSCLAETHIKVSNFKKVEKDILHKWGNNLEDVLIAIDIDRTSIQIDDNDNAVVIDPYLSRFISNVSEKGAKVLFLTARYYNDGNNEWAIKDLYAIDAGKTLNYLNKRWQSYSQKDEKFNSRASIKFNYKAMHQMNNSLFRESILFSRASKQVPFKGACLKRFLEIVGLIQINKVVLIDDDEGYLDEFREAFTVNNATTSIKSLTYHFIFPLPNQNSGSF